MGKKTFDEPISLNYPTNCTIDNRQIIKVLIILFGLLTLSQLAIGIDKTIFIIGIIVAIIVVAHTLLKLSAIFRPWSKTYSHSNPKYKPFVSIHVACKNEPAEIVIKTIEAIRKLKYKNFEVIVINNNNTDEANYSKIQKYIESCEKNFKFIHIDKMSGFKAGALNFLNENIMSKRSEIEIVVDSDYIVSPDFLDKTVGYFSNPKVGIVQAPQDYYNVNKFNIGLFYEYRSFFTIVMNQAQRLNLVTFTGTMGLIRTDFIKSGLQWNEWCITEDVEAGTHINSLGYKGIYVDKSLGKGLMPYDYASIIKQRQRWTYGNMQIIYKDLRHIISNNKLQFKQKVAFFTQLATWFHFELLIAGVYLSLQIIHFFGFSGIYINFTNLFMIYLLAFSVFCNLVYFLIGMRKDTTIANRIKAFLSHYGLLYVMSYSWLSFLFGKKLGFVVTKKERSKVNIPFEQFSKEFLIILILLIAIGLQIIKNENVTTELIIITIFSLIELSGIYYLRRAFIKSSELDTKI